MTDENWRLQAKCRGHDPEWWSLTTKLKGAEYKAAHAICRTCPVVADCLKLAERVGAVGMIFGGRDFPESRRALVRTWTT